MVKMYVMDNSSHESESRAAYAEEEALFIPEPERVTEKELTIVKVGTDAAPDWETVQQILTELEYLQNSELNQAVIVVWSRGVRSGMAVEGIETYPEDDVMEMRYLSGTGWPEFIHNVGQELERAPFSLSLTRKDLRDPKMHAGTHAMVKHVLGKGKIIVANEDDARSGEEFEKVGDHDFLDNDGLARRLAVDFVATRLIIVTDVPGVYDKDPKAHGDAQKFDRISPGETISADTEGKSDGGRGGMTSKRNEIELARDAGVEVFVTDAQPGQIVAAVDRWRPFRGTHLEAHPHEKSSG